MSASVTTDVNNNNNKSKSKDKKCDKSCKSVKAIRSEALDESVSSFDSSAIIAMHRIPTSSTSSAPPLSPPIRSNKPKAVMGSPPMPSTDDDNNDMPVLTPEVPFGADEGPPVLEPFVEPVIPATSDKSTANDLSCPDLSTPPLLKPCVSPAVATNIKLKSTNGLKAKKRKFKDSVNSAKSPFRLSQFNSNTILLSDIKPKKLKISSKIGQKKSKMLSINKCKKLSESDRSQRELEESSERLLKVLNQKTKPKAKVFGFESIANASNVWSVDSNHTMSSMNTSQPLAKCRNFDDSNAFSMDCAQSESLLAHNSTIFGNSFKFRQKLVKKSKAALNQQSMRAEAMKSPRRSLHNELIGVTKPEPEVDVLDGVKFQSFASEEDINLFSKFEQLEKEDKESSDLSKTYKIKSLKQGKMISPTKTKDITKIKGWREKLFSSIDDRQENRRPFTLSKPPEDGSSVRSNKHNFTSFISDTTMRQTSGSDPKSAFVSDLLDGYLKTKSDLKLNYLSPDLAPPPEDSPIFSASVLKMPDFSSPSFPPPSASTSQESSPVKRKFFKTKGIKNKSDSILNKSKPIQMDNDVPLSELLLPQYPVIRDTLWPDMPLNDKDIKQLCDQYSEISHCETQQMKRWWNPSVTMDDNYARFALSSLQCNPRIAIEMNNSSQNQDDVLMAVGLAPKIKSPKSPIKSPKSPQKLSAKETKILSRKKDREADLAKIIAMGNRSKRQIRLPSRFHESSLLMGNQWIIPDYDQKGKTGKRRLQEEQKRLQELHQRQFELEQRRQTHVLPIETSNSADEQLSLIHKNLPNGTKSPTKPKTSSTYIPTVPSDYPIKIPHQRIKQMQMLREQKKLTPKQKNETVKLDKSFTSLYSMSTQTADNKRVLSLSAKAAASATQRAIVNQLFLELSETIHKDKNLICRNGKLNKLETMKEALESINKLSKRDQQLSYIKKLLSMWNHKLQLCFKVLQKEVKPEAINVVSDVMKTYRDSMCYKVGEALEAKRKEFHEKRAKQVNGTTPSQTNSSVPNQTKKPQLSTGSQYITIPSANSSAKTFKMPTKTMKVPKTIQRPILPKNSVSHKMSKPKTETQTVTQNVYPKLTTPDLHQKRVIDASIDTEMIARESSILKPPLLTTRPTVLKPFMVPSTETAHKRSESTSVTGPIINIPDISKIKSLCKVSNSAQSLIAHRSSTCAITTPRSKLSFNNSISVPTTALPNTPLSSTGAGSQAKGSKSYSSHSYAGKNVIITSETPLANEDVNLIVNAISTHPDTFKKMPVRLSNGMAAALTIPSSTTMTTSKTSTNSSSIGSNQTIVVSSMPSLVRNRGNSSESKEESKSLKSHKASSTQSSISSLNLSQTNGTKVVSQKQTKSNEKGVTSKSETSPYDCIEID